MREKVLVFDVWGDYAHFRRGYTTTSPLTYPFPSRTALSGFLSAMWGCKRDSYYELFGVNNSALALQILSPINTTNIRLNLIDTKHGLTPWEIQKKKQAPRTQIPFEFIKKPKYRFYIWLEDPEKFKDLINLVKQHKSVYTPYLGITECIANFEIFGNGVYEIEKNDVKENDEVEIHSVIEKDAAKIKIEKGKKYGLVKLPRFMNNDRSILKYIELYYEEEGNPLKITQGEYYKLKGENINFIFF